MPNALADETSPYLRQHSENPVDWHPWGPAALALARETNRPLLVSIGYAACHWCHVMAHECFEDPRIAAQMNDAFVCIKVDREERPDVDAVCMDACQRLTGHGGWPLNVFMTPDAEPFFAGTYFPPEQRGGMASWPMVLAAIADAWARKPDEVREQAGGLTRTLAASGRAQPAAAPIPASSFDDAIANLRASFDPVNAGFGGAPKFPPHATLEFLLADGRADGIEMALATLRAMAAGGICDQVGGGFARYAVDATWTVPHFEKMLYDNALLARAYLHAWQLTGEDRMLDACTATLDFCLRELRGSEGGFCSSLDADSDGEEGRFYVWTEAELTDVLGTAGLGAEIGAALAYFGIRPGGNFEHGTTVLRADGPPPDRLPEIRAALLSARARRVRPGLDDKRLTAWNALMIAALADAGAVLHRPDYLDAARACAAFVLETMRAPDGTLLRTYKDGRAHLTAYLEDHAYLVDALLELYGASFEPRWYHAAAELADQMIERFGDRDAGGFFTTADGEEVLVARRRDVEDAPIPSGSSAAAYALLRLARIAGDGEYERWAMSVIRAYGPLAARHPTAFGHLLLAMRFAAGGVREVAIVGEPADGPLARTVRSSYRPLIVLAGADGVGAAAPEGGHGEVPLLEQRGLVDGRAAAYVCERFACQAPVTEPGALRALLDA